MSPILLVTLFVGTVIAALLVFETGLRFGRWRSRLPDPEPQLPVRTLVASAMSLLSFILGFTFALAATHFDSRSQSVFDEAVAISTAYHRADLLPDSERVAVQRLLREYIDARLELGRSDNRRDAIARLRQLQQQLWAEAVTVGTNNAGLPSATPVIGSLTEVLDVHGERVFAGFQARIPPIVWLSLYGIMVLSVTAAGYSSGLAGARRSFAAIAYALVFAAVIVLIAFGDVPGSEQFWKSHQALLDLQTRLAAP